MSVRGAVKWFVRPHRCGHEWHDALPRLSVEATDQIAYQLRCSEEGDQASGPATESDLQGLARRLR